MLTKERRGEIAVLFLKRLYKGGDGRPYVCKLDMQLRIAGIVAENKGIGITRDEGVEFVNTLFRELDDEEAAEEFARID